MDWSSPTSSEEGPPSSSSLEPSTSSNEDFNNYGSFSSSSINLIDLNWHDLVIPGILPYLGVDDLFRLRSASSDCKELVEVFLAVTVKIDLSTKKHISLEAFQVF